MTFRIVRRLLLSSGILLLPVVAYAQEATFTGTVTDSTGGVLPGVVVTAVLEATGNTFAAVTDDRGVYRIPARVGAYSGALVGRRLEHVAEAAAGRDVASEQHGVECRLVGSHRR